jgi:membrane associated rhomboid family serine protease
VIIPVGINHVIHRWPPVTLGIIGLCTLIQIYTAVWAPSVEDVEKFAERKIAEFQPDENQDPDEQGKQLAQEILDYGNKIPSIRFGYDTESGFSWKLFTCAFVHAGWLHLIGNMLFLWLCGAALEDRWGSVRFAVFYLAGSAVSALAFAKIGDHPKTLLVGASGAISALMGAFLIFFTKMQIRFAYWFLRGVGTFETVAYIALPIWLGEQFLDRWLESGSNHIETVAYMAHIGGFVFGFGVAMGVRLVWPTDELHDPQAPEPAEDIPKAVAREVGAPPKKISEQDLDRYEQCMQAIGRREQGAVKTLASRVILDLSRAGDRRRILDLYHAITSNLANVPLTDGAFAAAAAAADAAGDRELFVAIAKALSKEHPYSTQVPKVLWRLAEVHRELRQNDVARATLEDLAKRFPRDDYGKRAAAEVGRG